MATNHGGTSGGSSITIQLQRTNTNGNSDSDGSRVLPLLTLSHNASLMDLQIAVCHALGTKWESSLSFAKQWVLIYEDDEADPCTIGDHLSWHECVAYARVEGGGRITINIIALTRAADNMIHHEISSKSLSGAATTTSGPTVIVAAAVDEKLSSATVASESKRHVYRTPRGQIGNRPPGPWPVLRSKADVMSSLPSVHIKAPVHDDDWELVEETDKKASSLSSSASAIIIPDDIRSRYSGTLTFWLNGVRQQITNPSPSMKLIEYLRTIARLTGTKLGCGEGGCGACIVVISYIDPASGRVIDISTNSCLRPVASLEGMQVTTTEGLGSTQSGLHAIQKRMGDNSASQCGFCSSGVCMTMYGLLKKDAAPAKQVIEDAFDGNICRCTGYRVILSTMQSFAAGERTAAQSGFKRLPAIGVVDLEAISMGADYTPDSDPQSSHEFKTYVRRPLMFQLGDSVWFTPATLTDVYQLLATYSSSVIQLVVGNTASAVSKYYEYNARYDSPTVFIDISHLPSLTKVVIDTNYVRIGAAVTINNLISTLVDAQAARPGPTSAHFTALIRHLRYVANQGVRNVGSWTGNLMLAKTHPYFASDLRTILSAVGASVLISNGTTDVYSFVLDFMNRDMKTNEIVSELRIPFVNPGAVWSVSDDLKLSSKVTLGAAIEVGFDSYKCAIRSQNVHPLINAAFNFALQPNGASSPTIIASSIIYGGLQSGLRVATKTSSLLIGRPLDITTFNAALNVLATEVIPAIAPPVTKWLPVDAQYLTSVATGLFYKFYATQYQRYATLPSNVSSITTPYVRPLSKGSQVFTPGVATMAPLQQPVPKIEGYVQASGEAKYTDDIPSPAGTLYASYVYSSVAAGTIVSINAATAMTMPGVVSFISARDIADIGAANDCGAFPGDEEIFASTCVSWMGQAIGMILADTQVNADTAADAVNVTYAPPAGPIVITLEDAITRRQFFPDNQWQKGPAPIVRGDVDAAFARSARVMTQRVNMGSQAHFYMETQCALAIPEEAGALRVHSSSQGTCSVRGALTRSLGLPASKVIVETKRAGGGFGGKLSRNWPVACAVAVAAKKLGRPVRCQQSRQRDMIMGGHRHAHICDYKVGFELDGTVNALSLTYYTQGGGAYEGGFGCLSMTVGWSDSVYFTPNFRCEGLLARTNTPPNTACRGPGALNSVFVADCVMEAIAANLSAPVQVIREKNFYQAGQLTPYLQPIKSLSLPRVWQTLRTQSNYDARRAAAQSYNTSNKWRKRSVVMAPCKYGMGIEGGYMVGCQVNILQEDGTVVVSHTGTEIGQGINTKVAQAVAYGLGIDMKNIILGSAATDKIPNSSDTGGSGTSECAVSSAIEACTKLNAALAPIKARMPTATWPQLIAAAAAQGVLLTATGYYNKPPGEYMFSYFVWCAACTEVELDVLTGQYYVLRTDIVYDNGISLSPIVDIGQIEGAFMMGLGFFLMEHMVTMSDGRLLTNSTWEYKPPTTKDIPIEFNILLLPNEPNTEPISVYQSKATGEPPLMLAQSAYWALKECIASARAQAGQSSFFNLDTPATVEHVQKLCLVSPSQMNLS